jgi:hypothetical protein
MSSNIKSLNNENINISSIRENYLNLKEKEPSQIDLNKFFVSLETRINMLNWLIFLCKTLNFSNPTLFRVVYIFDQYLSKISKSEIESMNQDKLNLIAIACLSLSTKLEENNCNYIKFLNEKVLNTPNKKLFTNKDLTKMEFDILKVLKYKIFYSTPLDFIDIYLEIFSDFLERNNFFMIPEILSNIRNITFNIMKNNINNESYIINTSSHFSYLCFIQALSQVCIMNSLSYKQLEKIILIFNCQLENIF